MGEPGVARKPWSNKKETDVKRMVGVVVVALLPISALSLGFASAAGAATTGFTCSKLTGNFETSSNATFGGCTDPANTGKSGTVPVLALISGGSSAKITWAKKLGTTTLTKIVFSETSTDTCPLGSDGMTQDLEYQVTAVLGASTGKAKASIKKGWTLHSIKGKTQSTNAFICIDNSDGPGAGTLSLLPGTKVDFGPKP
jgi:hypothetical protein